MNYFIQTCLQIHVRLRIILGLNLMLYFRDYFVVFFFLKTVILFFSGFVKEILSLQLILFQSYNLSIQRKSFKFKMYNFQTNTFFIILFWISKYLKTLFAKISDLNNSLPDSPPFYSNFYFKVKNYLSHHLK